MLKMSSENKAYSVRTVQRIELNSTKRVWFEKREVSPSDSDRRGDNPYTMIALVVPGGWIHANLVKQALNEEEAWNRLVHLEVTRKGGLDIRFKYGDVPVGCYLNPQIVDELEEKINELEQDTSAASAAE